MINPFVLLHFMDNLAQYIGQESMFCFSFFILAFILGFMVHQFALRPLGFKFHIDYDDAIAELPLSQMKQKNEDSNQKEEHGEKYGTTTYPSALSRETWNRIAQGDVEALKEALSPNYQNTDNYPVNQSHIIEEKDTPQFHFSDAKEQDLQSLFQALFDESEHHNNPTKTINTHEQEREQEK